MATSINHELLSFHPLGSRCEYCAGADGVGLGLLLKHLAGPGAGFEPGDADTAHLVGLLGLSAALTDTGGRRRLRSLEALGDNALSTVLALVTDTYGWDVSVYQQARSVCTSNQTLAPVFWSSPLSPKVSFAADVSAAKGAVGAKSLEAMLGLLCRTGYLSSVFWAAKALGVIDLYKWPGGVTSDDMARLVVFSGALAVLDNAPRSVAGRVARAAGAGEGS